MAKTSDAKLLHLESLRGIAALAVAVYHLQLGSVFNNAVTDNAWLMVDFFFVLSGYVMALNYGERITTPTEMVSFQKKRFLRLFPLHVVMLLVFLAFEVAKYFAEARSGIVANSPAFTDNNAISFVFNFLLMHNLFGAEETWNGPSWSISAEFYTYIVFALLLLAFHRSRAQRLTAIGFVILASGYAVAMNGIDSVSWGLFRCLLSFFIGVLIHEIDTDRSVTVSPWLAVFLIGATIFDIGLAEGMTRPMLLVFPLLFAAVIVALNHTPQDSRVIRVLSHPWLVYLGTISFGIYMIHSAFWWVARQSLRFIFHVETEVTPAGITEIVLGNTMLASAIHVAGIAALLLAAHLSYRYFEKPIMNRFR